MMRVTADDLFAVADVLAVFEDEDEYITRTYRKKVATNLRRVYWKMLRAYRA